MDKNKIFINKKKWSTFTVKEMDRYQKEVFDYYRSTGFPYFDSSKECRDKEFSKLMKYDATGLLEDNVIKQTMHGLSLAWSYMPHSWDVKCNNKLTPKEVFENDDLLKKVIEKRLRMGDNMSDNGLRKMLKLYTNTQSVSNFRPTASYALYHHFCKEGDIVLDPSMGYGGRLLGAIKANVNYIGYDPCNATYKGLMNIKNDYGLNNRGYCLINQGSEYIQLPQETIDFSFTSPPYFDTEKYSDEDTQSYIKYPTKDLWLNGYLKTTLENVYKVLKKDKYMALNIANVKNYKNLEKDCVKVAESVGFTLDSKLMLSLSKVPSKNKTGYKYEPIYIFIK